VGVITATVRDGPVKLVLLLDIFAKGVLNVNSHLFNLKVRFYLTSLEATNGVY
jgi:hypothetical protein